ncbi:MAG TPA: hypothetical protein PK331_01485 [Gordonia sp. (in: high G+C Gram-positive bacteria)]|uniref:hypothetical protein n=1 Tax=unclassified Gordonia (in: high G+C Gram-positive bacteria) TaxID=2657482 RepID=UPI000F9380A2|nr:MULTISPECIES: hypothetical protein [unclassified Gordonia (in: high G+C Gram-positive bacteria)]RUP39506.1 MAG: hypothetical protein EKK60_06880 [Gordonia sp. (in: high G+C Gram-positive bacteria)]HNP57585.1 hypothetical protein [Gordonia sp. (in: high G+C Gram-positive bacteria)]HRC49580.1 hypothetical protein [Gordonia sp. (in: high G+C Gram-positive bacteria)]
MGKATSVFAAAAVALGTIGAAALAAPAAAAPPPIPPPAFPIPPTKPVVKFSTEQSRLVATVSGLPLGEKFCRFDAYFGDPTFGSLGVRSWQTVYQRYELFTSFKIRSVPKPAGTYPVRITCLQQEDTVLNRGGEIRIP